MEDQTITSIPVKKPYEPPKATFVSLRLEERLMVCGKLPAASKCKNRGPGAS